MSDETHISTEQRQKKPQTWLFTSDEYKGRTQDPLPETRQGTQETVSLKRYGLSRDDRIRRSSDFTRITREGKRIPSRHFIIFFLTNDLDRNRLGITASRKVGGAVVRNRVKRIIREVFRTNRDLLPPGGDIVVIAKHNASEADYAQIRDELAALFSQVTGRVSEG